MFVTGNMGDPTLYETITDNLTIYIADQVRGILRFQQLKLQDTRVCIHQGDRISHIHRITLTHRITHDYRIRLRETLPEDLPVVFISAVTGFGLEELKDVLWAELNAESNKLAALTAEDALVHRDKDMSRFAEELADEGEDEDIEYIDEDEIEDLEDFELIDDDEI